VSIDGSPNPPDTKPESGRRVLGDSVGVIGVAAVLIATLFLSSGRLDWVMAWLYLAARVATGVAAALVITSRYPGLLEERFRPGAGVRAWDRPLSAATMLLSLVTLIVAGLDVRFGWPPGLSLAIRLAALSVWFLADVFSKWAAIANRFYSRVVRIQEDRGHTVVTDGPYRYVRHPGYAGALLAGFATPVALGSLWGLLPACVMVILLVHRTALEDEVLREQLPGYSNYALRTRYRLLPGVW